ncbi:hypothetical protein B0H17DRAFT_1237781 [Mycena rosella]|uniref:Uncharacterized protein n=1 Tax=Mycena rosella TaxID=1033263 RepID=A0AAD7G8D6_MYCRO|nr:hypothetical protein B0H17DRAFT_1237781 [Mycena rosella]
MKPQVGIKWDRHKNTNHQQRRGLRSKHEPNYLLLADISKYLKCCRIITAEAQERPRHVSDQGFDAATLNAPILTFALSHPLVIRATQVPLQTLAAENLDADSSWNDFSAVAAINAPGHLIFDTVSSLLQHWPNTRYCNGHNIIPGTVPVGILLYHGRPNGSLTTVPEWMATDPEHAYPFCGLPADNATIRGCWHLTSGVTRPLKVLYFDGSSAANTELKDGGTMDAQDLLVWGKVDPSRWRYERERIDALCAWRKEFDIDGYVRTSPHEICARCFLTLLLVPPRDRLETLYRVAVDRYADRLELLEYLLNTPNAANVAAAGETVQTQLRVMHTPYILQSARPTAADDSDGWSPPGLQAWLTASERLLLGAFDETNREICRVVRTIEDPHQVVDRWRADTHALMAWLDWSVWIKCRPACGVEEMCYLPTWPYFYFIPDHTDCVVPEIPFNSGTQRLTSFTIYNDFWF